MLIQVEWNSTASERPLEIDSDIFHAREATIMVSARTRAFRHSWAAPAAFLQTSQKVKTGFSFDADDHLALASHISHLCADRALLKQMGTAARLHAERFCLPRIAEEFDEFLQETRNHAHRNRTR